MKESRHKNVVTKINNVLATHITMIVGSIWVFYAFVIFGLTPVLWPEYETEMLYWSNFLQLVFLPVITEGTAILNRDSEQRAIEDYYTIRSEFDLLKESHRCADVSLHEIAVGILNLLRHADIEESEGLPALASESSRHKSKRS